MRQLAILSALLAGAFGQTSPVPYFGVPSFSNEQLQHSYPGTFSSIRKVDFLNFRYGPESIDAFPLKDGHYKHDQLYDHQSVDLDSVHYLPSRSLTSNGDSALVLLSWFAAVGSYNQGGVAEVFTLSDSRLRAVQEISWDTHFQAGGPTESFDASTSTLLIRSAHYIPGDAHCCVSAMDVVTFRWDGAEFVQASIQTELSKYGKDEGKTLPSSLPR